MRRARIALIPSFFVVAMVIAVPLTTFGQATRDKFVITAKAGGVNAVTGRATMHAKGETEWQQLTIKEDLEAGDVVRTGHDGRVEMLLNPGSYLRMGENSELELSDNSLQNLEVRLIRGTAIVEATGFDGAELLINISTPHTRMAIVRKGLYRVSVVPGDTTELIVRKGRVILDVSHTKVNGGNKVVFSNSSFSVAKLTDADKDRDALEAWSKDRSKTVAQANRGINRRDMMALMAGFNSGWGRYGRFSPQYSGIWMYSAGYGCYTFLPFYDGWGSPYGSSYSNIWYPSYCCRSAYGNGPYYPTSGSGGGTYTPPSTTGSPNPPSTPPPSMEPRSFPSVSPSETRNFPSTVDRMPERSSDQSLPKP